MIYTPSTGIAAVEDYKPKLQHALNPDVDWPAIERKYLESEPHMTFVDNFLHHDALQALVNFCNRATVFYDVRVGYLGAYMREGLDSPILRQIALVLLHSSSAFIMYILPSNKIAALSAATNCGTLYQIP